MSYNNNKERIQNMLLYLCSYYTLPNIWSKDHWIAILFVIGHRNVISYIVFLLL